MRTIITNEGSFKRYENKLQLLASAREKLMLAAVDNDKETVRVARDYQKAYYSFLDSVADYLCGKEDYSAMLPQKGSFTLFLRSIYINYLQHQEALSGIHFGNRNQEHWQELVDEAESYKELCELFKWGQERNWDGDNFPLDIKFGKQTIASLKSKRVLQQLLDLLSATILRKEKQQRMHLLYRTLKKNGGQTRAVSNLYLPEIILDTLNFLNAHDLFISETKNKSTSNRQAKLVAELLNLLTIPVYKGSSKTDSIFEANNIFQYSKGYSYKPETGKLIRMRYTY